MQVAGVVILYHPDEEQVIHNIESYITNVGKLLVFDNSGCRPEFIEKVKNLDPKINFITNLQNEGIARPLNKAFHLLGNEYEWLLTMDQDSFFEPDEARIYFDTFQKEFCHADTVAVVCPNHALAVRKGPARVEYKEVAAAITSGSLIHTRIWKQVNGFEEKLFIDDVDMEYGYRCTIAGFKTIQFTNVFLNHFIGTQKQAGYFSLFKKSGRIIHSPPRVYYMVRNFCYVSTKYKKLLPQEIRQRKKGLLVMLKNNLFFSGNFFRVLIAVIKGYLHFKLNRFSS